MKLSIWIAIFSLPILINIAAPALARPWFVKLHLEPHRGLNARVIIYVGLTTRSEEVEVHLFKIPRPDTASISVQEFRVKNDFGEGSSSEELRDYAPDPYQIEIRTELFLRLGTYEVEVRDGEGAKRSKSVNIENFPQILLRRADQEKQILALEALAGLPRSDPASEELATIELIAPPEEITTDLREFKWRSPAADARYIIYLFNREKTIWSQPVDGTSVRYGGPPLVPDKTYYWTVAGEGDDNILACDQIRKLVLHKK